MQVDSFAGGCPVDKYLQALGENIRRLLGQRGVSNVEFTRTIRGVSPTYLSQLIGAKNKNPKFALLVEIARGLEVPVGELLMTKDERERAHGSIEGCIFRVSEAARLGAPKKGQ